MTAKQTGRPRSERLIAALELVAKGQTPYAAAKALSVGTDTRLSPSQIYRAVERDKALAIPSPTAAEV